MSQIQNWFSNMKPLDKPFIYQGVRFSYVENFFQAMKTDKSDLATRAMIATMNPYSAKKFGKNVKLRPDWNEVKLAVMEYALAKKFAPGTSWYAKLMATGDEPIIEYNTWNDHYWGVCNGVGKNHLGRLLMKLRDELRDEH